MNPAGRERDLVPPRAFGLLAWFISSVLLWGSTPAPLPQYSVRIWQSDDGLPQNSVFALAQGPRGYLWVGTREGLARFDGMRFTVFDHPAAPDLKHGWITALWAARDGSLWIACDGHGVVRLRQHSIERWTEAEGLPSNQTRCLLQGSDGSIWIGSEGGLTRWRDGNLTHYTDRNGLGDNSVRALCEQSNGTIRAATKRGLTSISPSGGVMGTISFGAWNANALRCVLADRDGPVWTGSNEGLTRLAGEEKATLGVQEGLPDKVVNALYRDQAGQLWIGTYTGLARMDHAGAITSGPRAEAVFADIIYTIFEDAERNLWVGGSDGLYRLTQRRFTTLTTQQGLSCDKVMSIIEDRTGTLWVATWGGGLDAIRNGRCAWYTSTNQLTHDFVLSLHEGADGSLWAGMDFDGGLNRLRLAAGKSSAISRREGLLPAAIRVVEEDKEGALWVGTSRGLNLLRNGTIATYATTNGLAGDLVLAILNDSQGRVWVGTDGGLCLWEGQGFTNFTTRDGLSHNVVGALFEDAAHDLWIGTRGGGLNRLHAGRFTAYRSGQGLFSDEIYEILEDDFGGFWMSCRRGIFRVSRREFDELDAGRIRSLTSTAFGKADGLLSVQCNGVAKPSGWKSADGRLWFPTIRGLVAVEPGIHPNQRPPPVVIETLIANSLPVTTGAVSDQVLRIPPGPGELEIQYTALSLQAPEKNRFKYQLEGVDPEWIDAGSRRVAYYSHIGAGRYVFRVQACNNDGVWNNSGASLEFIVQPHYWQTWWFKLSAGCLMALGLIGWYRLRVARLRALEHLRVQIAANLHDDVGARLTKVAMITEHLDRETPDQEPTKIHIKAIFQTTREIVQAMDEIVWTINPRNDTLDNLANYIFQYAQDYFADTPVRCRLDLPAQLPERTVSTEQRHNLFMAFKEALNNILKHSAASEVGIRLAVAERKLRISITDNGRGFDVAQAWHRGEGLANMRRRLHSVGGRLLLESGPGSGTRIEMEAPAG